MHLLSSNDFESLQKWLKELKEFQLDSMFDTNVLGRAYLYTNMVSIIKNTKNSISALVGEKNYKVRITSENHEILGECTCPYEGKCKHLAAIVLSQLSDNTSLS